MEEPINISIKKIKDVEFSINTTSYSSEGFSNNFNVKTQFNTEKSEFEIRITYDILDILDKKQLAHIIVSNIFEIKNIVANKIPNQVLITMLSLSISHTRALLAKNTSGTTLEHLYIPIINPTKLATDVFDLHLSK